MDSYDIVGFTGTKKGMTKSQKEKVRFFLVTWSVKIFHHGCCIGADDEAGIISLSLSIHVIGHPPIIEKYKADCICHEYREPKSYFVRDHDIVDETDCMIATPKNQFEELRSGTWATVRYARKQGKHIYFIWPDGGVTEENDNQIRF